MTKRNTNLYLSALFFMFMIPGWVLALMDDGFAFVGVHFALLCGFLSLRRLYFALAA